MITIMGFSATHTSLLLARGFFIITAKIKIYGEICDLSEPDRQIKIAIDER
jgi:hypothetical protein